MAGFGPRHRSKAIDPPESLRGLVEEFDKKSASFCRKGREGKGSLGTRSSGQERLKKTTGARPQPGPEKKQLEDV